MSPDLIAQILVSSKPLILVSLIHSVVGALICGVIAARRRDEWVFWSAMGFLFGLFAIPFVVFSKSRKSAKTQESSTRSTGDSSPR